MQFEIIDGQLMRVSSDLRVWTRIVVGAHNCVMMRIGSLLIVCSWIERRSWVVLAVVLADWELFEHGLVIDDVPVICFDHCFIILVEIWRVVSKIVFILVIFQFMHHLLQLFLRRLRDKALTNHILSQYQDLGLRVDLRLVIELSLFGLFVLLLHFVPAICFHPLKDFTYSVSFEFLLVTNVDDSFQTQVERSVGVFVPRNFEGI